MFWYVFLSVLYLVSLAAVLAFVYSAGVLNSRSDRLTEQLMSVLRREGYREAA